jgi:hypothetical protein
MLAGFALAVGGTISSATIFFGIAVQRLCVMHVTQSELARAFSSEVDTGSRFHQNRKGSGSEV